MTFNEWWKKLKPAECDEVKDVFVECWRLAQAAEREACALIAEHINDGCTGVPDGPEEIAEAIRARSNVRAPDFEALRALRNVAVQEMHQKMADEWGVPLQSLRSNFKPTACYCACGTGGPCEHKWDGPDWESEDGCACSVTCSLCGYTAMSHDMRNAP